MNRKALICCGILSILIAGCPVQNKSAGTLDDETLENPRTELLRQIDRNYTNPALHYQLGKLYHVDGLFSRAEWEYNVAMQFDPVFHKAQAAMVKLLADMGDKPRSAMAAEMYMNQAAASAQNSSLLGRAFQKEGMDNYAVACYQQALSLAPNSAVLHRQIGYYYLAKGDTVRAEEYLRRSIQLDPFQPEVAEQLGRMGVVIQVPRNPKEESKAVDKTFDSEEQK